MKTLNDKLWAVWEEGLVSGWERKDQAYTLMVYWLLDHM